MENKEVMVCTFPATDFLEFNAVDDCRFIKWYWLVSENKEKKAFELVNNFCDHENNFLIANNSYYYFITWAEVPVAVKVPQYQYALQWGVKARADNVQTEDFVMPLYLHLRRQIYSY